jgi:AraC-like DNA-binding protein
MTPIRPVRDCSVPVWLAGLATLSLAAIATRTGFKHTEYMTVAFTKRHGMPPSRWRKQRR